MHFHEGKYEYRNAVLLEPAETVEYRVPELDVSEHYRVSL
jgi:hypothetical protein